MIALTFARKAASEDWPLIWLKVLVSMMNCAMVPPSTNGLLPRPIEDARNEVYHLVDQIHGESLRFRRDIAGNHDFALNKAVTI